jgi:hypothetical protein
LLSALFDFRFPCTEVGSLFFIDLPSGEILPFQGQQVLIIPALIILSRVFTEEL